MAKNLKFKIKNTQLAEALDLNPKIQKPEKVTTPVLSSDVKVDHSAEKPKFRKATALPKSFQTQQEKKEDLQAVSPEPSVEDKVFEEEPVVESKPVLETFAPQPVVEQPVVVPAHRPAPAKPETKEEPKVEKKANFEEEAPKKVVTKDFKEVKAVKKPQNERSFDTRDRLGLRTNDDEAWKRRRAAKFKMQPKEELIVRPTELKVPLPIILKDLAAEMKLKASDLIAKLFKQGIVVKINDILDDEIIVQLIGEEFGCKITIDTSEKQRLRITEHSIKQEIDATEASHLITRAPIVAFMGHVDHGKTSLIDAIRKTNMVASESGAITQHIGAFRCVTDHGEITVLDTPGHEAFSAMRTRGANLTDIVVIVVAGDEGIKTQTDEAINQAKAAGVPIIVAINKADKPGFKPEDVYRQLSERELLPEAWGGTTITVNCSATSKMGIKELLEMILLQAEVLELKANPKGRARGTVIESEIQKGLGATATLLVQNGSLKPGDALVIDYVYGKVKTMHDEHGKSLKEATPSYPVRITGLSDLPVAGCEFIVVGSEKEARKLTEERLAGRKRELLNQPSAVGLEGLLQRNAEKQERKVLNVIIKADVQGSIEAIKNSLGKIKSTKAELNIIFAEVGEISESDIQRANASGATILGFHTSIESHADSFIRELQIQVFQFDVIYHLIDKVKSLMTDLLDKIRVETQVGCANVQAIFKSSQLGLIAGCIVTEGSIKRSHLAKLVRNKEVIWQGDISSLKRVQEDVREVTKGIECGILLNHFNAVEVGDQIQTFEVTYIKQEL